MTCPLCDADLRVAFALEHRRWPLRRLPRLRVLSGDAALYAHQAARHPETLAA